MPTPSVLNSVAYPLGFKNWTSRYVQFVSRAQIKFTSAAHAAAASTSVSNFETAINIPVLTGTAFQFTCTCFCFGTDSSFKLTCQSYNVFLNDSANHIFLWGAQLNAVGYPLGPNGVMLIVPPSPMVFYDDLANNNVGSISLVPNAIISAVSEVTNTDTVNPHSYQVQVSAQIDTYAIEPGFADLGIR